MSLRLGGDGAITGCSSLAEPALTLSGITVSGAGDVSGDLTVSGNLGIGVSNPTNSIEVESLQADVKLTATGNNPPDINLHSDRNPDEVLGRLRGHWSNTVVAEISFVNGDDGVNEDNGEITFRTASAGTTAEVLRITDVGRLGIKDDTPGSALQVGPNGGTGTDTDNYILFGRRTTDTTESNMPFIGQVGETGAVTADLGLGARSSSGSIRFYTGSAADFTAAQERIRIESGGDVGINITNPETRLHVYDGGANILKLERSTTGNVVVEYTNTTNTMYAGLATTATGWGVKASSADIANDPLFFIERTTGDVGINTSNPNHNLDITSGSGDVDLRIYNPRAGNSEDVLLRLEVGGSGTTNNGNCYIYFGDSDDINQGQLRYNHENDFFSIAVNNGEKLRILSNGNIGIGSTTASQKLYVTGNIASNYAAKFRNDGNNTNRYGIAVQCGTDNGSGTSTLVQWQDGNGTNIGKVTFSGGAVTYGTFTAIHPATVPADVGTAGYPYGTLVETISISYRTNSEGETLARGIIYNVQKTQSANSRKVLGAYSGYAEPGPDETEGEHEINVLGDGHILCNNSGGDIAVGDGICSSATPGIGQKATASPSMIIGIAQEAVTFTDSTEEKLVPVQYGLQQFTPWS